MRVINYVIMAVFETSTLWASSLAHRRSSTVDLQLRASSKKTCTSHVNASDKVEPVTDRCMIARCTEVRGDFDTDSREKFDKSYGFDESPASN